MNVFKSGSSYAIATWTVPDITDASYFIYARTTAIAVGDTFAYPNDTGFSAFLTIKSGVLSYACAAEKLTLTGSTLKTTSNVSLNRYYGLYKM